MDFLIAMFFHISLSLFFKGIDYDTYHVTSNLQGLDQYSVTIRKKRQAAAPTSLENSSQKSSLSTVLLNSNESATTTETSPSASNSDSTELNRSLSISAKDNVSLSKSTGSLLLDRPLLGVNGTGQRKNLTKPFTVSEPIPSDSSSSTKILKSIKLGSNSGSDESIIDDVDVPLEDTKELAKQNNITEFKEVRTFEC